MGRFIGPVTPPFEPMGDVKCAVKEQVCVSRAIAAQCEEELVRSRTCRALCLLCSCRTLSLTQSTILCRLRFSRLSRKREYLRIRSRCGTSNATATRRVKVTCSSKKAF